MNSIAQRAALLASIRGYFHDQKVVEVVTNTLRPYTVTDPHLASLEVKEQGYLQTSPEYAMKILLASFGESIYQICPAYRSGEQGAHHRQEFQMLEWYRVGFTLNELMDDVIDLLGTVGQALDSQIPLDTVTRVSYRSLFENRYQINPHSADIAQLQDLARNVGGQHLDAQSGRSDYLDALFSVIDGELIEPTIVFDYPACQAALAQTRTGSDGDEVSCRFELFIGGLEIANAYQELNDSAQLRDRFEEHNKTREESSVQPIELDEDFLSIVDKVPACSGIALGVDRLQMALSGAADISQVQN